MLTTWSEARAYLARAYPNTAAIVDDDRVQVVLPAGGSVQAIECRRIVVGDQAWIAMATEVAPANKFRVSAAMYMNVELVVGALALHRGAVVLQQCLPLNVAEAGLHAALDGLAHGAAHLRELSASPTEK